MSTSAIDFFNAGLAILESDPVACESALRRALELDQGLGAAHHALSVALERQERFAEAAAAEIAAISVDGPDSNRSIRAGRLLIEAGNCALAEVVLREAHTSFPGNQEIGLLVERVAKIGASLGLAGKYLLDHKSDPSLDLLLHGRGHVAFSQFGEDGVTRFLFQNEWDGFYVDVGCHDPFALSNTAWLHLFRRWSGINIDADQRSIEKFRSARPHDINLHCGVGGVKEVKRFFTFEDGSVNTFDPEWVTRQVSSGRKVKHETVLQIYPLCEILDAHLSGGQRVGLLNIDAEGLDVDILRSSNWQKYVPSLVLIEDHSMNLSNPSNSPTFAFLQSKGYRLLAHTVATSAYVPLEK